MLRISLVNELCRQQQHGCQYAQAAGFVFEAAIISRFPAGLACALFDAIHQSCEQNKQTICPASLLDSTVNLIHTHVGSTVNQVHTRVSSNVNLIHTQLAAF